jgi:hypothetical protein
MRLVSVAFACVALAIACSSSDENAKPPDSTLNSSGGSSGSSSSGDGGGSSSGSSGDGSIEPSGPPAIRYVGRFDTRSAEGPTCAWPGCRIIARFDGTAISAKLEEIVESWMDGAPSEWDVVVDGAVAKKIVMTAGTSDYELAAGLPAGKHVVELYKRSETQNGKTRFRGFDYHGGALLAPPVAPARRIEIVGDSQPAAFGIEGVGSGPDCPGNDWAAKWQNFHRSFGARLGETFDADVHGTVYSGKGMVKNIWRPDTAPMPAIFGLADPLEPGATWDFSKFVPDVVIVMLGGNDFAEGQPDETAGNGPATPAEFEAATDAFAGTLRTKYPQAHIYLALSPSVTDADPAGRESRTNVKDAFGTVATDRKAGGDTKIHFVEPAVAQPSELTGCNGHGSPAYHDRLANDLAAVIKADLGW